MGMVLQTTIVAIMLCASFGTVHAQENRDVLAKESIEPVVSYLLLGEKPPIYKCKLSRLADLNGPGISPYAVGARFTDLGNLTLFFADHVDYGTELWVTDGTAAGTHIVKDINPGPDYSIFTAGSDWEIVRVGDKVFFLADDGVHGEELWVTDGTNSGTKLVKDIEPGGAGSWIRDLTLFQGKLFFLKGRPSNSPPEDGLWVSDGTPDGTHLVAQLGIDIWSGARPGAMAVLDDQLIFAALGEDSGYELWQSNGTSSGTSLLKNITPGSANSHLDQFTVVGNKVFFLASDGIHGTELWVTNGTANGTHMVKDIYPGPERGAMAISSVQRRRKNPGFQNKLCFVGRTAEQGEEVWITDGTLSGTKLVRDISPGPESSMYTNFDSFVTAETFNGHFYFPAEDPIHDESLWRINEDGTTTLFDLNTSIHSTMRIEYLTANDDYLFFCGSKGHGQWSKGQELYIMDKENRFRFIDIYPNNTSRPQFLHIRNDQSLLFETYSGFSDLDVGLYRLVCPTEE